MNKKKITFGTIATALTLSSVAAVVVSCGTETEEEKAKASNWAKFGDEDIKLEQFYNTLAKQGRTADANQIQDILKKSISFLYEKEQKASENMKKLREQSIKAHAKRKGEDEDKAVKKAGIKSLDKIADIEKRVKSEFEDEQTSYKKIHGHGWEKTWPAELAKNKKYGGARSDKEAISNLVNAQLSSNAFGRFSITKTTTWYKGDIDTKGFEWLKKLKDAGLVFSNDKNTELDKLDDDEKVIVVGTKSFDVTKWDISPIIKDYLTKYDPMVVNHLLLKATPNEKEGFNAWKIDSLDTLKSWLVPSKTAGKTTIDNLSGFKGLHYDATKKDFIVSDEDSNLLKSQAIGNSAGTQKIGGSLGMQDQLDYVSGMVPGFALPILATMGDDNIQKTTADWMKANAKDPLDGISTKILDALATAAFKKTTTFAAEFPSANMTTPETWFKAIERLIKTFSSDEKVAGPKVLEVAGRVLQEQFVKKGESERDLIYTSGTNKMVVSKFGIHIINGMTISELKTQAGFATNTEALLKTIMSDVQREVKGDGAYFNTLSNVSKNSGDKMFVLESLMKDAEFTKFLKTQENYGAPSSQIKGDTYPKYTDAIITKDIPKYIENYKTTSQVARAKGASGKLEQWMNTNFQNTTLKGQTAGTNWDEQKWKDSLDDIYKAAREIAKVGAGV